MWGIFGSLRRYDHCLHADSIVRRDQRRGRSEDGTMISESGTTALVSEAFSTVFGRFRVLCFIAFAILLFGLLNEALLGWSQYGSRASLNICSVTVNDHLSCCLRSFRPAGRNDGPETRLGPFGHFQRSDGDPQPYRCSNMQRNSAC